MLLLCLGQYVARIQPHDDLLLTLLFWQAVHLVFNRYEPRHGGVLLFLTAGIPCLISAILFIYGGVHPTFFAFFKTVWIFLTSLTLSVVAYRVSPFHPLAQYPGPVFLRISRLFALYIMLSGKQQLYYHELHRVYGPYLRTGLYTLPDLLIPILIIFLTRPQSHPYFRRRCYPGCFRFSEVH